MSLICCKIIYDAEEEWESPNKTTQLTVDDTYDIDINPLRVTLYITAPCTSLKSYLIKAERQNSEPLKLLPVLQTSA